MITAQELRIGNLVIDNRNFVDTSLKGKFIEVESIGSNGINLSCGAGDWGLGVEVEDKYLDGIPLTPDILITCGFIKTYSGNSYRIDNSVFTPWLEDGNDGSFYVIVCDEEYSIGTVIYLHQLQNLYYALTNKELEINL